MKSDVVTSSKIGPKLINVDRLVGKNSFADCHKWHIKISLSAEMFGLFYFLFVRWSFIFYIGVSTPKIYRKSDRY